MKYRFGVMTDGAVVAAHSPVVGERWWNIEYLSDLCRTIAFVHHPHGLVVNVFVQIPLPFEKINYVISTPSRPMVLSDQYLGPLAKAFYRVRKVVRPHSRVTHFRTA